MKTLLETLKYYNLRMNIEQLVIFTILNNIFENIYTIFIIIIIIIIIKTQQKSCFQRNIVEKKIILTRYLPALVIPYCE